MVEMVQAPQGGETHLATKRVKGAELNLDDDQAIMTATDKSDGMWRFRVAGQVIAEAQAPSEVTHAVISQWANAVRARTKRELSQEDVDRRLEARKQREASNGIVDPDGNPITSSVYTSTPPAVESVSAQEVRTETPEEYLERNLKEAEDKVEICIGKYEEAQRNLDIAYANRAKFQKLVEAMKEDDV